MSGERNHVHKADLPNRAKVQIFGDEYVLKGEASEGYISRLADTVDRQMRQVSERDPRLPRHHLAILTAIHLADELARLQDEYAALTELLEEASQPGASGHKGERAKRERQTR